MGDINWLKDNYLTFLKEEEEEENTKDTVSNLQKQERIDEANLEKIKLNIIEIFSKMFNISCNGAKDPIALKEKYLGFFDKITKPWYINKDKALEFGKEKEVIIEEIKIEEAENLKKQFKKYCDKIDIN